jgi:hypothetical protein
LSAGGQWTLIAGAVAVWALYPAPPATPPLPALSRTNQEGFVALLYDGVRLTPGEGLISTASLRSHLLALRDHGYQFITLEEARDFMLSRAPLPEKAALLTFADGRLDTVEEAEKVLLELRVPAVLFPRLEAMDSSDHHFPTWRDLRALARTGRWSFGSRGLRAREEVPADRGGGRGLFLATYAYLPKGERAETQAEWRERVVEDVRTSDRILRSRLAGWTPGVFAFPCANAGQALADGGEELRRIIAGTFPLAFSEGGYAFNHWRRPRDRLTRLPVKPEWTGAELATLLDAHWARRGVYVPASSEEWVRRRGLLYLSPRQVTLCPEGGRSAEAWIAGSESWRCVRGEVELEARSEAQAWLYLRASPGGSFLRLGWTGRRVEVQASIDGRVWTIAAADPPVVPGRASVAFDLLERRIRFRVREWRSPQGSFPLPAELDSGMAGLGIWCIEGEPSPVAFEGLRLEPRLARGALVRDLSYLRDQPEEPLDVVAPEWYGFVEERGELRLRGAPDPAVLHLAVYRGASLWPVVHLPPLPAGTRAQTLAAEIRRAAVAPGTRGIILDLRPACLCGRAPELEFLAELLGQVPVPVGLLADRPLLEAAARHPGLDRARLAAPGKEVEAIAAPSERLLEMRRLGE